MGEGKEKPDCQSSLIELRMYLMHDLATINPKSYHERRSKNFLLTKVNYNNVRKSNFGKLGRTGASVRLKYYVRSVLGRRCDGFVYRVNISNNNDEVN